MVGQNTILGIMVRRPSRCSSYMKPSRLLQIPLHQDQSLIGTRTIRGHPPEPSTMSASTVNCTEGQDGLHPSDKSLELAALLQTTTLFQTPRSRSPD